VSACLCACDGAGSSTAGRASTCIELSTHRQAALQLRSDVLVKCFAVQTAATAAVNHVGQSQSSSRGGRPATRLLFRCQFHTAALNASHPLHFTAADLDLDTLPHQGQGRAARSLDGLRVQFNFSPTSSSSADDRHPAAGCEYIMTTRSTVGSSVNASATLEGTRKAPGSSCKE